jgi:hypothetical protein
VKTPGLALTAALGFFVFWAAAPAHAQRYQPEKWEECSDPKLVAAFEKLTGQKPWKLLRQPVSMSKDPAREPEIINKAAWVLGPPKDSGGRISEGRVEYFFLGAKDDHTKLWWPGDPSQWWSIQETQTPNNYATRYVVANPPPGTTKDAEVLVARIYGRPIFADPEIPAGECLELIDATFRQGLAARDSQESIFGSQMWDGDNKPNFAAVEGLRSKGLFFETVRRPTADDRRMVSLSQGGNGMLLLFFRREKGQLQIEDVTGAHF